MAKDKAIAAWAEKTGNDPEVLRGLAGSIWTWTGLDADSKLMVAYHVGVRDAACAAEFVDDLASRLANRVQMTTDGLKLYLDAVDGAQIPCHHSVYRGTPAQLAAWWTGTPSPGPTTTT